MPTPCRKKNHDVWNLLNLHTPGDFLNQWFPHRFIGLFMRSILLPHATGSPAILQTFENDEKRVSS